MRKYFEDWIIEVGFDLGCWVFIVGIKHYLQLTDSHSIVISAFCFHIKITWGIK